MTQRPPDDVNIRGSLANMAIRALARAMDVKTMVSVARRLVDPNYDLHERTGFQRSIPIPNLDAAQQVVEDIRAGGHFLEFVNLLIEAQENGLVGRKYSVPHLRELVKGVHDMGFDYDHENRIFVEDPRVRKTRNWGVLREGEDYVFTFLRIDVVGNTALVRRYSRSAAEAIYRDIGTITLRAVERRNGRLWSWQGDGGLFAFYFANKNSMATLAGMEIIHEMFLYNLMSRKIEVPVRLRMAVHNGTAPYTSNEEQMNNSDVVRRTAYIESTFTRPETLTVSNTVYTTLEPRIAGQLSPVSHPEADGHYCYQLRWER